MTEQYPLPVQQDAWGNCYDLPPQVYDRYYTADVARQPELANVARAICGRCVIIDECRAEALKHPQKNLTGIIAGVPRAHITTARAWLAYEVGARDTAPRHPRPQWLGRSDASEAFEAAQIEDEAAP